GARAGADEERVDVSVIATRELEDRLTAGDGACQAERAHRRLGSRVHQANLLDRGEGVDENPGQLDLAGRRGAEAGPRLRPLPDGRAHARRGMSQDERPPRPEEI